jgi:hemoglobin-like flavoprotein
MNKPHHGDAMDPESLGLYAMSLERCDSRGGFTTGFYRRFLASSPEVARRFADTQIVRQAAMLRRALGYAGRADLAESGSLSLDHARMHGRSGMAIPAELYDLWLDCLVDTAREFDPEFDEETEAAWRAVMGRLAEIFRDA